VCYEGGHGSQRALEPRTDASVIISYVDGYLQCPVLFSGGSQDSSERW
jgi:hypothetical protein